MPVLFDRALACHHQKSFVPFGTQADRGVEEWVLSYAWACGPPIDMKMGLSGGCTLLGRGRRGSVYTLDEARPFLSLIGNARFEPICVAPLLPQAGDGST